MILSDYEKKLINRSSLAAYRMKLGDKLAALEPSKEISYFGGNPLSENNDAAFSDAMDYFADLGGGIIELPEGTWNISNVKFKKGVRIKGNGWNTILKSIAENPNDALFELFDNQTDQIGMFDLRIDGNKEAQVALSAIDAILLSALDGSFEWYGDPYFSFDHLFIQNCTGNGINIPPSPDARKQKAQSSWYSNIIIRNCDLDGIVVNSTDNFFSGLQIAGCRNGIYNNGGNNSFINSKTYWNKRTGLYLAPSSTGVKVSNYEAQEEYMMGICIEDAYGVEISNAVLDSIGHDGEVNNRLGKGILLDGARYCKIKNTSILSRENLIGGLAYGVEFQGNPINNDIEVSCVGVGNASVSKPFEFFNDIPIGNNVVVNNVDRMPVNIVKPNENLNTDEDANGVCNGFTSAVQSGVTANFSIDGCQRIDITANTGEAGAYIYMEKTLSPGTAISAMLEGKKSGDVYFKLQINWFNGENFLSNVSGTNKSSQMFDYSVINGEIAPETSTKARICLFVLPVAAEGIGSVWFNHLIVNVV